MKAKRRTEITFETHEITVVGFRQSQPIIFCEACQTQVSHLSVAQAVSIFSLSALEIKNLAATGQIHSNESEGGLLTLCGNSLAVLAKEL